MFFPWYFWCTTSTHHVCFTIHLFFSCLHAASSELSVVELWQLIRKKRPFETRHDLKREGSSGKAVTRKTPATLEPIHERMDSTTSDPALPVSPGSERPETPSQKDVEKDSKDPTVLGRQKSSFYCSSQKSDVGLSWGS